MGLFKRAPEQQKQMPVTIPERDQLDSLRHRWLARLCQAGGDLGGAAVAEGYADLVDAYNEAKQMRRAYPLSADWDHRYRQLREQLRNERAFWREIRMATEPDMVRVTNEDIQWPTDDELLRGA